MIRLQSTLMIVLLCQGVAAGGAMAQQPPSSPRATTPGVTGDRNASCPYQGILCELWEAPEPGSSSGGLSQMRPQDGLRDLPGFAPGGMGGGRPDLRFAPRAAHPGLGF